MKSVINRKEFWKTMRPFCLIKTHFSRGLTQKKNNRIISDDLDLPEEFSTFFEDTVRLLKVKSDEYYLSDRENLSTPVEFAIW